MEVRGQQPSLYTRQHSSSLTEDWPHGSSVWDWYGCQVAIIPKSSTVQGSLPPMRGDFSGVFSLTLSEPYVTFSDT